MQSSKPYLRSADLARLFDVNPSTIALWVKKGKLRTQRTLGGNFRFRTSDVERLLAKKQEKEQPLSISDRRKEPRYAFQYPASVKIGNQAVSFSFSAMIRDISGHGLGLAIDDGNSFAEKLGTANSNELTISELPATLFKETVIGEIRHMEKNDKMQVILGVSLD